MIAWVLLATSPCGGSSPKLSTRTFVYTTPYLTVTELLKLGVEDFVFYLPLNESEWQNATLLFDDLRGNHGKGVFIVAGKDVNRSWTFEQAYTSVSTAVDAFRSHIDGFVCWDDPLSKGGADLRNAVVECLRADYPGVWFAVCLDLNRDRMEALERSLHVDLLDGLNLSLYDSIMAYYYTWINASGWNRSRYREMQGTMDSGALYWLQKAVDYTSMLGSLYAREIWFIHNAHSVGNLTVTTRQMELDLEISKRAGVPHIGWFTLDKIGEGPYSAVRYFGGMAAFDASARYDFLRTILVERAREPSLQQLLELPEPARIVALLLIGLAMVRTTVRKKTHSMSPWLVDLR